MTDHLLTCQICGRVIKANTGLIAHHGYRRPQPYRQTRGCFGARHVPYEQGHDALDEYITRLTSWLADAEAALAKFIADPPATLARIGSSWRIHEEPVTYTLPKNFDAVRHAAVGAHSPKTYQGQFTRRVYDLRANIKGLTEDLTYCHARRVAWSLKQDTA